MALEWRRAASAGMLWMGRMFRIMDRVIYLIAWRIALLSCLIAAARADFVAYTFFGAAGSSVSNVTRLGIAGRLILNQPIVFESFDSGAEGPVSLAGWSARQFTDPIAGHAGNNLNDPLSDAYLGWVLISQSRLQSVFGGERLRVAPGQELNGAPITALLSGTCFTPSPTCERQPGAIHILARIRFDRKTRDRACLQQRLHSKPGQHGRRGILAGRWTKLEAGHLHD